MSNELYLIISYFVTGIGAILLGAGVFFLLRRSYMRIISLVPNRNFSAILKKVFLAGAVLPAMLGFFSVSFKSCTADTYRKVIEKRSYLVEKNQEQVSSSLNYTVAGLLGWSMIVFGIIVYIRKTGN
ncbi:MAG: hypothetical protein C4541_07005 [Candidatus Auribacter fodinae]|jgi:hypothetical protein|uniref:Uncharacterized protein n=1 Tax=Candidatus Auribacter fodinae TaxID=2093366 RepID=A0A3A4QYV7_9BACT|nr:MAG: hypothetical protein C4541_07005 [Candidatus Auribacter fodinae]